MIENKYIVPEGWNRDYHELLLSGKCVCSHTAAFHAPETCRYCSCKRILTPDSLMCSCSHKINEHCESLCRFEGCGCQNFIEKSLEKIYVVFDTETMKSKVDNPAVTNKIENITEEKLRYIYAIFNKPTKQYVYSCIITDSIKTKKREWTKQLITWANSIHMNLHVWAHNASFDVRTSIDFDYLKEQGCDFVFVCVRPFIFKIKLSNDEHSEIVILDTFSFFSASLQKLAGYFNMSKINIDWEHEYPSDSKIKERCKVDVMITRLVVENIYQNMHNKVAVSLPQLSYHDFMRLLRKPIEKCLGLAVKSYHGGRTEIFKRGKIERVARLDLNSSYPWSMQQPLPVALGNYSSQNPSIDEVIRQCSSKRYVATLRCIVNVPKDKYIGPFPFVAEDDKKMIFPVGKFEVVINSPELDVLDNWKYIDKILEVQYYRAEPFLKLYSDKFYNLKLKADKEGDKIFREHNKLKLNALYGKFGQKKRETKKLPRGLTSLLDSDIIDDVVTAKIPYDVPEAGLTEGEIITIMSVKGTAYYTRELDYSISPAVASFITSYSRARLYQLMMIAGDDLVYVDTDCLVLTNSDKLNSFVSNEVGFLKVEFKGTFYGYAPKFYVADGEFRGIGQSIEFKTKGVPRAAFIEQWVKTGAVDVDKTITMTYNHIYALKESLRRFHTTTIMSSPVVKSVSLVDDKRVWYKKDAVWDSYAIAK